MPIDPASTSQAKSLRKISEDARMCLTSLWSSKHAHSFHLSNWKKFATFQGSDGNALFHVACKTGNCFRGFPCFFPTLSVGYLRISDS